MASTGGTKALKTLEMMLAPPRGANTTGSLAEAMSGDWLGKGQVPVQSMDPSNWFTAAQAADAEHVARTGRHMPGWETLVLNFLGQYEENIKTGERRPALPAVVTALPQMPEVIGEAAKRSFTSGYTPSVEDPVSGRMYDPAQMEDAQLLASLAMTGGMPMAAPAGSLRMAAGATTKTAEKAALAASREIPVQSISSAKTSLRQIPALLKSKVFEAAPGSRNLDLGGGAYDMGTEYLANERGVKSFVLDPFNRPDEHNKAVAAMFKKDPADTVTVANVLNVIKEPGARLGVIKQAYENVKPGGKVYFDIYEGNRSGEGAATIKGFQNNAPAQFYLDEIKKVFPDVTRKGTILIATKPKPSVVSSADDAPVRIRLGQPRTAQSEKLSDFIDAFENVTDEHPFSPGERLLGDASVSVSPFGDKIHLSNIQSLAPGTGAGTRALEELKRMADEYGVEIGGTAQAYARDPKYITSTKRLVDWYRKNGFEILGGNPRDGYDIVYRPGARRAGSPS